MSAENPPTYNFSGIDFNPSFYVDESNSTGITQEQANALYLQKTIPDTATALETFSGGIKTNTIDTINTTDVTNISTNSTGNIFIGTSASRTSANPIQIGTTSSLIRFGTSSNSQITSNNLSMSNVQCLNLNSITPTATFGLLGSHTGAINIGNIISRTGDISIASNQTTGTGNIVIGSAAITTGTQSITINRPLTIGYDAVSNLNNTFDKIGSHKSVSSNEAVIVNNVASATSLVNFTNVPQGIYLFNYQIDYKITVAQTVFTQQKFILSTTENNFVAGNIIGGPFSSLFKTNQESVPLSVPINEYTQTNSKCGTIVLNGTTDIYLNYRIVHNGGTTVPYIVGSLRLVRIG